MKDDTSTYLTGFGATFCGMIMAFIQLGMLVGSGFNEVSKL